ncbi:MAG TPA: hypothetical protein VJN67_19870 [Stellaceae bacterium]|nr:hypothetical protein [Stellaceae bacterium]
MLADTTRRLEPLRRRVGRACIVGLLLTCGLALTPLALAQSKASDDSRDAAASAVRSLDLQTDLPRELTPVTDWHFQLPAEVFWLILIVGLAALLFAFWDELPIWRLGGRRDWSEGDEAGIASEAHTPEAVAAAADDLARQGRFGEAMHALLLQSLADVRRRLDEQFADSLTSREILRSTKLPTQGREPLREIIARVERTHFGEYFAGPQDYTACRDRFAELERVLHATAPA